MVYEFSDLTLDLDRRELTRDGACVLYVSHKLDEVFELCDRVTLVVAGLPLELKNTLTGTPPSAQ